jgi:hypothetical protein
MRRREIIAAALSFCRTSLTSTSTVSSVTNNLVVELEIEVFELLLSTRSSGELSSGVSLMISKPWCSTSEEFEAIDKSPIGRQQYTMDVKWIEREDNKNEASSN